MHDARSPTTGPNRTTLEIIIPSQARLTSEKWKETATLCPLDWPSNYSLLRLWQTNGSLHQTEARLRNQLSHSHMFAEWTVHLHRFAELFFLLGALCLSAGHHLRLTRGPAGNRTTTGSLSAPSRTTPYQLSHEDTSPQICRACLIPATCSLCSGTCLANQPAGTKLPRQESPQEGSSERPGRTLKGDPSASAAC